MVYFKDFLFLATLSVFFTFAGSRKATDISSNCKNGSTFLINISSSSDSRTLLLHSDPYLNRNCSIEVLSDTTNFLTIVVFEFLHFKNAYCVPFDGHISLFSADQVANVSTDLCKRSQVNQKRQIYTYLVVYKSFTVHLLFTNYTGTIRLTLTPANDPDESQQCTTDETFCMIKEKILCIDKSFYCDGNVNCGTPNLFDENCDVYDEKNFVFTLMYGTILFVVVLFFFVQILRGCVPTVGGQFYTSSNRDEERNLFELTSQSLPPYPTMNKNLSGTTIETQI